MKIFNIKHTQKISYLNSGVLNDDGGWGYVGAAVSDVATELDYDIHRLPSYAVGQQTSGRNATCQPSAVLGLGNALHSLSVRGDAGFSLRV